jgi:phosphotransferase family enzyme
MSDEEIIQAVEQSTGRRPRSVERLTGGANNVVVRVETGAEPLLAKIYFTHARDPRDRLGTEFNTLTFLWENGVRCVPRPIAMDRERNLGLYEFVRGDKPLATQIGAADVEQLAAFLGQLWTIRDRVGSGKLPNASEAQFSIATYRDHVLARLDRVETTLKPDASAAAAVELVQRGIRPAFDDISRQVGERAAKFRLEPEAELPAGWRTLSPADHGFHNTLRNAEGRLVFLDFEYAGWDQPAQMIANACLQPELPLPADLRKPFVRDMLKRLPDDRQLLHRLRLIYPLLSLKWSLIMLNEFMPVSGQRRSFAGTNAEARRASQLEKSRRQLEAAREAAAGGFFLDDLIDERDSQPLP